MRRTVRSRFETEQLESCEKLMKQISNQNKNILGNVLGAFVVNGGSLLISVALLPLYLRFFQNQEMLGVVYDSVRSELGDPI